MSAAFKGKKAALRVIQKLSVLQYADYNPVIFQQMALIFDPVFTSVSDRIFFRHWHQKKKEEHS